MEEVEFVTGQEIAEDFYKTVQEDALSAAAFTARRRATAMPRFRRPFTGGHQPDPAIRPEEDPMPNACVVVKLQVFLNSTSLNTTSFFLQCKRHRRRMMEPIIRFIHPNGSVKNQFLMCIISAKRDCETLDYRLNHYMEIGR